jgi:hypothetical protein
LLDALSTVRYTLEGKHRHVFTQKKRSFSDAFYQNWQTFFSAFGPGHGCTELASATFLATSVSSSSASDTQDQRNETQVRSSFVTDNKHAASSMNSSPCFNLSPKGSLLGATDESDAWDKIDGTAPTEYVCVYDLWIANPELEYREVIAIAIDWFETGAVAMCSYI